MVCIGIDLGTTNSVVAVFQDGVAHVIQDETGSRLIPSQVTFTNEKILVGALARDKAHSYPEDTIYDSKRFIGQKIYDKNVLLDASKSLYKIISKDNRPHVKLTHKSEVVSIEEVTSHLLKHIKGVAENYLDEPVTESVIAVPAHFDDARRNATKKAAKIAGFEMVRVLNEPTAAAIASQYKSKKTHSRRVLVYDFGGGTFDVSIVSVCKRDFSVIATDGDSYLGGKDIDARLQKYIKKIHNNKEETANQARRLILVCEDAKKKLSFSEEHVIELQGIADDYTLTRRELEEISKDLLQKTTDIIDKSLQTVNLTPGDIDEVVLVGGSSRIPKVKQLIATKFPKSKINTSLNPDEAIASGAAIYGAQITGEDVGLKIQDVLPHTIGIESWGGVMNFVILRNTKLPCSTTLRGRTSKNFQDSVIYRVLQGESLIASNNNLLGEFEVTNIRRERRGVVEILTKISVDEEGILKISALEVGTENSRELTISIRKEVDVNADNFEPNYNTHKEELGYVKLITEGNTFLNYCEDLKFDYREKLQERPDVLEKIERMIARCKSLTVAAEVPLIKDMMAEIKLLAQEHLQD